MAHRRTFVRSVNLCAGMAAVMLAVSCIWCTDDARAEDVKQLATHPTQSRRLSDDVVHVPHQVRGLHRLEGHRGNVLALVVAPRVELAVSAGENADLISWDLRTGRQVRRISLRKRAAPKCLAITSDGGRVLVGMADGSLRQYDPLSGRDLGSRRAHQTPVRQVAISDDGKSGASATEDSVIHIWDLETRAERASIPKYAPITDLRFVGNEEILFSSKFGNQKHILYVRSVLEDKNASAIGILGDRLSNALFLPEQRHVLAGVPDSSVKIWQLPYQNERRQIYTRLEAIEQIALSPDGKYLIAYGGGDIEIRRFDSAHGAGRYSVPIDGHAPVVLSEDGRYLLSADGKGTIHVWGLPGPIDDDVVGESFTVPLHNWLRAEDYQELENMADTLREQQLYLPWGDSYLHNFYNALGMSCTF